MRSLVKKAIRFLAEEDGPTAVEYAMMIMLIFLACLTMVGLVGQNASSNFQESSNSLKNVLSSTP